MKKEFISYKQALALKELGFDEPCFSDYINGILQPSLNPKDYSYFNEMSEINPIKNFEIVLAPLYQQAFRWFREKYKLQAEILWRGDMNCFCYKTGNFKRGSHDFSKDDYNTYEEAELECLKKLIEIVNEKQAEGLNNLKKDNMKDLKIFHLKLLLLQTIIYGLMYFGAYLENNDGFNGELFIITGYFISVLITVIIPMINLFKKYKREKLNKNYGNI